MRITMRKEDCSRKNCGLRWDTVLVGPQVDDRGKRASDCVRAMSRDAIELSYNPETMQIALGQKTLETDELDGALSAFKEQAIVLETTTLGFVEILLCCRSLMTAGTKKLDMLYMEPGSYRAPKRMNNVLERRDFELSNDIIGFEGIPGTAFDLDGSQRQTVVFTVGYEGGRLDRAFEQLPLNPSRSRIVFGVPAFQPGWEMDAFSNNVRVMRERELGLGVSFCGAENPLATMQVLEQLYRGENQGDFFVATIGTKPHAIGAALFVCKHPDVGVLYDHPRRRPGRSKDCGCCHIFHVEFGADYET